MFINVKSSLPAVFCGVFRCVILLSKMCQDFIFDLSNQAVLQIMTDLGVRSLSISLNKHNP